MLHGFRTSHCVLYGWYSRVSLLQKIINYETEHLYDVDKLGCVTATGISYILKRIFVLDSFRYVDGRIECLL
jgi:hypothetical protein